MIGYVTLGSNDVQKAAAMLSTKHLHGLICIAGTFHLGHLVLELTKRLSLPLLLWGLNELPYNGGKIRLNSVCGINLNASNLYKAGVRNYHVCIGDAVDEDWIDAIRIGAALSEARMGIVGFRAKGFFNLEVYDLNVYRQMGVLLDHFELLLYCSLCLLKESKLLFLDSPGLPLLKYQA